MRFQSEVPIHTGFYMFFGFRTDVPANSVEFKQCRCFFFYMLYVKLYIWPWFGRKDFTKAFATNFILKSLTYVHLATKIFFMWKLRGRRLKCVKRQRLLWPLSGGHSLLLKASDIHPAIHALILDRKVFFCWCLFQAL